jgi:N-carbamoylputrescine amidase
MHYFLEVLINEEPERRTLEMRKVKVAATQMACALEPKANIEKAEAIIRKAAEDGANIILIQELFETQYFAQTENYEHFKLAHKASEHETLERMSALAKELGVVLPISFFEKAGTVHYNTTMVIDADGMKLGIYRKSHIPDDPGYYEKFYFSPGDTGLKVWDTKFGKIGIGICWDQWFPEVARSLALMGAEILLYPTAIGTAAAPEEELKNDPTDFVHWQNVMLGHAAANAIPVVVSNRIGLEKFGGTAIRFWGKSFIADPTGRKVKEAGDSEEEILIHEFDLDEIADFRTECCFFRDRRPELYGALHTLDGKIKLERN